jgi:hypothetical protein
LREEGRHVVVVLREDWESATDDARASYAHSVALWDDGDLELFVRTNPRAMPMLIIAAALSAGSSNN